MEITIRQCLKCMKIFDGFQYDVDDDSSEYSYDPTLCELKCPHCHEIISKEYERDGDYIELCFEW